MSDLQFTRVRDVVLSLGIVTMMAVACVASQAAQRLPMPDPVSDRQAFEQWQQNARHRLRTLLGIPEATVALAPQSRGQIQIDDFIIEKWVVTLEPGSRAPALLYRPLSPTSTPLPAVILTFGHGGSKSASYYQYMGQVLAKMNMVCLAMDPVGEEERHKELGMGTRAHDDKAADQTAWLAGRPILGKMLFDTMRGIDFLLSREDIDPNRIGVVGNSLGGKVALWMTALDPRLRSGIVSGSGSCFSPKSKYRGKPCTRTPALGMLEMYSWHEFLCLTVPHCSVVIANGDSDTIADKDGTGEVWRYTNEAVARVRPLFAAMGKAEGIRTWYEKGGGHRPYFLHPDQLAWLCGQLKPPGWTSAKVLELPRIQFGVWANKQNAPLEPFYGTQLHQRGAIVPDMSVRYLAPEILRVLRPEEVGTPQFTLAGWIAYIQQDKSNK